MLTLQKNFRKIHRLCAPIMALPIVLTTLTGIVYQMADLNGADEDFGWLLEVHKGNFGPLELEKIYPFLNGLGLLVLLGTGIVLWIRPKRNAKPPTQDS
jgi:cytochrome b subunit of formate dehydrogenase